MFLLLSLATIPPILITAYFVRSDKFPEPNILIIKTFILGIFIALPAGYINYYLIWLPEIEIGKDLSFLAGFTEESLKFLALYFFIKPKIDFNEPMDAIVYGVLISLGFAALENIEYVFSGQSEVESIFIGLIRAFTAIPMHAMCGVIMGYYFAYHIFQEKKFALIKAIFVPMIFHSTYNFLLGTSLLMMILFLIFMIRFGLTMHREFISMQKNKYFEEEIKKI